MPVTNQLCTSMLQLFFTSNSTYLALHSSNPTNAGLSSTEIIGGSYARQPLTWNTPSGRSVTNSVKVTYTNLPATTITYLAIWDAVTGGHCLWSLAISSTIVTAGGTFVVPISDLAIAFA